MGATKNNIKNKIKKEILENDDSDKVKNITENEKEPLTQQNNDVNHVEYDPKKERRKWFQLQFEVDLVSILLFAISLVTRLNKLEKPTNIVFDELHYGKYVSLYMKNTFFFDSHPPLGKQLIAGAALLSNFDESFKFDKIGSPYPEDFPLFALRIIPAVFGSLLVPLAYHLMLEFNMSQWTSLVAALLFLFDNALLTQSRFILMESMIIFFSLFGILCLIKFKNNANKPYSFQWCFWLILAFASLTCSFSIKYVGFYTYYLALFVLGKEFFNLLSTKISNSALFLRFVIQSLTATIIPIIIYVTVFYIHLGILYKAGPHDSIMTSAFQASLEGGLASITKGQPLVVAHGSQVTLRHTHGRTCWLHSHDHVYPIRYPDKRGSSHQQQVTCYSFKDVNNWWIVKRPQKSDLAVEQPIDAIKHGDIIQLVHGITSRALNSHDVAAPVSPQCQEVSCYINYNVSMNAQNLWRVEIINLEQNGDTWHTIQSLVRLIHVDTNTALKFSGRQLPDWGFHQHEVVADRIVNQDDTVWNVEEHRYTKSDDQKERERDLITAEMIPTSPTSLSFWDKFLELHYKMWFSGSESVQNHMYSSEPLEWPLMSRGIAYWISTTSNAQIHLLGNVVIWYSATIGLFIYFFLLIFYLLRRRRLCYDLDDFLWKQFCSIGEVFFVGYIFHYLPFFFFDKTLFVHHYLPAFTFKILLLAGVMEHIYVVVKDVLKFKKISFFCIVFQVIWMFYIMGVFSKFSVLSYGTTELTTKDILDLRWKDTWDFIVHKK